MAVVDSIFSIVFQNFLEMVDQTYIGYAISPPYRTEMVCEQANVFLDVHRIYCSLLKKTSFIEFFYLAPNSPICVMTEFGKIQKVLSLQLLFPEIVGIMSPDE